jgi:hypothetical protein
MPLSGNRGCESAQPGQGAGAPAGHPVEGPFGFVPEGLRPGVAAAASTRELHCARPSLRGDVTRVGEVSRHDGACAHGGKDDRCVDARSQAERRTRRLSSTAFPPCVCGYLQRMQESAHTDLPWDQANPSGAKRSPSLSRRRKTSSVSKRRSRGSCFAAQRRTSAALTGVDTVGVGIARTE